jgi:hypothetical protein
MTMLAPVFVLTGFLVIALRLAFISGTPGGVWAWMSMA